MSAQGRTVFGLVAVAAAIGGFWFMLIAPKRADSASIQSQIIQAQARRDAAVSAAATAGQARAGYQHDYATVARLGKAVPGDDDVASLVYQLESVARANKIDFRAVKLTGAGAAPAAPAPAPAAPADSAAAKGKTATAATPVPTVPAAPVVSQAPPGAVVGSAGLLTLPFTLTFDGGYMPMQHMLGAIDRLADATDGAISVRGRLLTIDGFSLAAGPSGFPKLQAQVSATAYITPAAEGVPGGPTAPVSPAGTPAAGTTPAGSAPSPTTTALVQGARP